MTNPSINLSEVRFFSGRSNLQIAGDIAKWLGRIYFEQGRLIEARKALESALEMAFQHPFILNPGSPLEQLGEVSLFEDNLEQAQSLFEQALTNLTEECEIFLAIARTDLAEVTLLRRLLTGPQLAGRIRRIV